MQVETEADKSTLTPLHWKRSEEAAIRKDHNAFKVLLVGGKLSPCLEKKGEIRIYVDFQNLNRASLKDIILLPKMDYIL